MKRDPDSLAAREVLDAVIKASIDGSVSQDAVGWAGARAYEQFRKEARATAVQERERAQAYAAERAKREHRTFWARVWGNA